MSPYLLLPFVLQQSIMKRPINKLKDQENELNHEDQPSKLQQLRRLLQLNSKSQLKLKKIREDIVLRMQIIQEYVSTYRLRSECPPATGIISYLKFERNTPFSFRQQYQVIEQQQAIKNTTEDDCLFVKKLKQQQSIRKPRNIPTKELPKDPHKIDFNVMAIERGLRTGLELYRIWFQSMEPKKCKRPFEMTQQSLIINKQRIYGDNWQKVCQFVQQRSFQEIYYEFHNRINPKIITGRWGLRHSLMLIVLLQHYGLKKWAQIAQKMIAKSQLQVRERYCNIMDPTLGKNTWTPEQQRLLLLVAPEHNFSWKNIAKLAPFVNKTDNCVWRKFRNIMIHKTQNEIKQLVPENCRKGLADKLITYKRSFEAKKITSIKQEHSQQIQIIPTTNSVSEDRLKNIKKH